MNQTLETIHRLHSTHGNFSERTIPATDLVTILQAAVRAASASARQTYSIIVVDEKPVMKEYLQYVGSHALIFCVDFSRLRATAERLQYPYQSQHITDFITGSTDTILAAQTAAIAAKSLGIDSLFTNSIHRKDLSRFYQHFNLPAQDCFPLIGLILGYASGTEQPVSRGRFCGKGLIHFGKYQSLTPEELDQLVAEYDDPNKHLGLVFKEKDKLFARYMDWFFQVWVKPGDPATAQHLHKQLYQHLAQSGFLDSKFR